MPAVLVQPVVVIVSFLAPRPGRLWTGVRRKARGRLGTLLRIALGNEAELDGARWSRVGLTCRILVSWVYL